MMHCYLKFQFTHAADNALYLFFFSTSHNLQNILTRVILWLTLPHVIIILSCNFFSTNCRKDLIVNSWCHLEVFSASLADSNLNTMISVIQMSVACTLEWLAASAMSQPRTKPQPTMFLIHSIPTWRKVGYSWL